MINDKLSQFAHDEALFQEVKRAVLASFDLNKITVADENNALLGEQVRSMIWGKRLTEEAFNKIARLRETKQEIGNKENPAV
mgnify:CR=1 FL=1